MFSLNRVIVTGYLGKDPETAQAAATTVTKFSLAVTDRWKDGSGEKQERTNWLNIVVWNGNGENVAQYLKKGSHVLIEGSLRTSEWDDKETGQKRWKTEIHASQVIFLDKKAEEPQKRRKKAA
ncbi:MAG: single-strand DNA-binding protein [Thermoanaerobaculia bacterium]|nr:single-strand DNA-binding protein [Thermoanaerobaculia bacterium]